MTDERRAAGRPREGSTGPALLASARRLVGEHGYDGVTIGMIAADVGVGRQTIYRRWPSKADLVLDAFLESASREEAFGDGSTREVLKSFLINLFDNLATDGPAIRSLIASAQSDPGFRESFRERFVEPRAEVAASILRQGIERGEITRDIDLDMTLSALHGAFWYQLLQGKPLDEMFADRLVNLIERSWSS